MPITAAGRYFAGVRATMFKQLGLTSIGLPVGLALCAFICAAVLILSAFLWGQAGQLPASCALAVTLAWASFIDIHRFLLPNILTLGLLAAGFALSLAGQGPSLFDSIIGAAGGYALLFVVTSAYRQFRGVEGLGKGDAKLMAAAGSWIGWQALPPVLLLASMAGIVYFVTAGLLMRRINTSEAIPFGPFIAAGFWSVWLIGPANVLSLHFPPG